MSTKQAFRSSAIFAVVVSVTLAASAARGAAQALAEPSVRDAIILENVPVSPPLETPQAAVPPPAVLGGPADAGAPAAAAEQGPAPAKSDAETMISDGQDLALQGAARGDRLMVMEGRRMIRDGALLKRAQLRAQ